MQDEIKSAEIYNDNKRLSFLMIFISFKKNSLLTGRGLEYL